MITFVIPSVLQFTSMIFAYIKQKEERQNSRIENKSIQFLETQLDTIDGTSDANGSFFEPLPLLFGRIKGLRISVDSDIDLEAEENFYKTVVDTRR